MGVVLDGPYGGTRVEVGGYDRVLLVAGGSGTRRRTNLRLDSSKRRWRLNRARSWHVIDNTGISFLLGTVRHLMHRQSDMVCKHLNIVYTCRTSGQ